MINNNENFLAKIISLVIVFAIYIVLFVSFWNVFFTDYFNGGKASIVFYIMIAIIAFSFLAAYTVSNSLKPFTWKAATCRKSPIELRLMAHELNAMADMIDRQKALAFQDAQQTIADNHNIKIMEIREGKK